MEATREVEGVQRKLQVNEVEFAKAEETLREMERRVAEQRREVERQHACVDRTRGELATAQGAEHLANIVLGESQKDSQTASERVTMAEAEVTQRQEREREATACHRDSQSDTARQLAKRDLEERELHACREREAVRRVAEDESVRAVEEHEKYTQQLEHNNMELNVNRRQVEEEERPLLEQELKLRLLRESLEENEARLRTEHRSFHSAHGRGDTVCRIFESSCASYPLFKKCTSLPPKAPPKLTQHHRPLTAQSHQARSQSQPQPPQHPLPHTHPCHSPSWPRHQRWRQSQQVPHTATLQPLPPSMCPPCGFVVMV